MVCVCSANVNVTFAYVPCIVSSMRLWAGTRLRPVRATVSTSVCAEHHPQEEGAGGKRCHQSLPSNHPGGGRQASREYE